MRSVLIVVIEVIEVIEVIVLILRIGGVVTMVPVTPVGGNESGGSNVRIVTIVGVMRNTQPYSHATGGRNRL